MVCPIRPARVMLVLQFVTISEWFCGIDVNRVNYLRTDVVTSENTADFEPCQW
ncbi:MAG: hypothetical protein ACLVGQ_11965 [Blautia massiliensis (ex Durand et al. 2017)]|uniref:hypothetical protein n=1 Tax=Blautia massiliensis (ex Durand et al. 2017) TaxID=1737424 RepID=UPI00399D4B00